MSPEQHAALELLRYHDLTLDQRINMKAFIVANGPTDPALKGVWACYQFFGFVQAINFFFSGRIDSTREMWG